MNTIKPFVSIVDSAMYEAYFDEVGEYGWNDTEQVIFLDLDFLPKNHPVQLFLQRWGLNTDVVRCFAIRQ